MKGQPVVGVQPEVLKWARESIGKSLADVACTLKKTADEIEAWENGSKAPTYVQLEELAYEIYKRPLAMFFLPAPPQESKPVSDFRTLPEEELLELLPDTYLNIRRARAYQVALKELFGARNPAPSPIWSNITLSERISIEEQAAQVRAFLDISLETQKKWSDDDMALKQWRSAIERAGVFVFKNAFKQNSISSFCLNDEQFPIIYLNNSTTKTRQIFSLFHELAHVLLRMNGLTKFDEDYIKRLPQREQGIEKFCNEFAAEILIPEADFAEQADSLSGNIEKAADGICEHLAKLYCVSREAILRRFLNRDEISSSFYKNKASFWEGQQKMKNDGGGNYYHTQKTYLSDSFLREVFNRFYRQQITKNEAAEFLDIKPGNFNALEEKIFWNIKT
jgi:Zn-dependent peptidase ImmA (M78 family)